MREFTVDQSQDEEYELFSVLVHSGGAAKSGHYYSYIRTSPEEDSWYKFNDLTVEKSSFLHASELNFGGERSQRTFDPQRVQVIDDSQKILNTAYMLAYVRRTEKLQIMRELEIAEELPLWLRQNYELAKKEEAQRQREQLYTQIKVLTYSCLIHSQNLNGTLFTLAGKNEEIRFKGQLELEVRKDQTCGQFLESKI